MKSRIAKVGAALAAVLYAVRRKRAPADAAEADQQELRALLDEVRSLRQDLEILKANPAIGQAVDAALAHARRDPSYEDSSYAVAVRQTPDLGRLANYNVIVAPDLGHGERPPDG